MSRYGFTFKKLVKARERLFDGIDRSGGPDSCWEWQGLRGEGGYGLMSVGSRAHTTHRLVMYLEAGRVLSSSEVVCHQCDNPPCCNPGHLSIGTQKENIRDMLNKGRGRWQRQTS